MICEWILIVAVSAAAALLASPFAWFAWMIRARNRARKQVYDRLNELQSWVGRRDEPARQISALHELTDYLDTNTISRRIPHILAKERGSYMENAARFFSDLLRNRHAWDVRANQKENSPVQSALEAVLRDYGHCIMDLQGVDLMRFGPGASDMRAADLRGANLSGANLDGSDLEAACLRGANLRGANLTGANLRYANLRDADLRGANLWGANLKCTDLEGAILRRTRLTYACLAHARLIRVDLSRALFEGVDLEGAFVTQDEADARPNPPQDWWETCRLELVRKIRTRSSCLVEEQRGKNGRDPHVKQNPDRQGNPNPPADADE